VAIVIVEVDFASCRPTLIGACSSGRPPPPPDTSIDSVGGPW
jgi:hypothetical protein